jgi:nucleoid-associated protein YgaU
MRVALWIAVLLAAFAVAWLVQERWAQARRDERDAAWQRPAGDAGDLPEGYSRAVVGAPSGSPPIVPPAAPPPAAQPAPRKDVQASPQPVNHRVRKGETLSEICAGFYGTARADVVEALARRNGLSKPEVLRAGQVIVIPPLAELRAQPR